MKRAWMCLTFLVLLLAVPTASADVSQQDLAAARALADSGFELYEAGDYATAFERFRNAELIFHAPPHLLFMARCQVGLGKLVEARKTYQKLAAEQLSKGHPVEFVQAQQDARAELTALNKRIPTLTVVVQGADPTQVRLTIDDAEVDATTAQPVALDPGDHRVEASADGYVTAKQEVHLAEGAAASVNLLLQSTSVDPGPEPHAPPDAGQSLLPPIVVMSVGGLGLLVGVITGAIAVDHASELKSVCPDRQYCASENQQLEDTARAAGTASTISFVIGGVGAAGGLVWLLLIMTSEESPEDAAVRPYASGDQIGVRVAF